MKKNKLLKQLMAISFATQFVFSCSSQNNVSLLPLNNQNNLVQTQSFSGVYQEIEDGVRDIFYELDSDSSGSIIPQEYGVNNPESSSNFKKLDKNNNGKVTLVEMMPSEFTKLRMASSWKKTANLVFEGLDKDRNKGISEYEIQNGLVSPVFFDFFLDYDNEKKNKGLLTKSEFQNLFAYIESRKYPGSLDNY